MMHDRAKRTAAASFRGKAAAVGVAALLAAGAPGVAHAQTDPSIIDILLGAVGQREQDAAEARQAAEAAQAEAAAAQAAADTERAAAEAARERAAAAEERAADLENSAEATEAERDAARREADEAQQEAEAAQQQSVEAEERAATAEQDAEGLRRQLEQSEAQLQAAQQRERQLTGALVGAGVLLLAIGIGAWVMLRRRRRQLEAADDARREAEAKQRQSEEELAAAVKPAPFSCVLEGTATDGASVLVKIDAAQLGASEGVVVGRNPAQSGVLLDHAEASREHLRLTVRDGGLYVCDLDSTNGTFVNGDAVPSGDEVALSDGDRIGVGAAIEVRLTISPEPAD